jgi:hypothetical protein
MTEKPLYKRIVLFPYNNHSQQKASASSHRIESFAFQTTRKMDLIPPQPTAATRGAIYNPSSPCSVVYKDQLWVAYFIASMDGAWWTVYNGNEWSQPQGCNHSGSAISLAVNTSPSLVVFQDLLYLFYNGSGNNGTFYITWNGTVWSPCLSVSTAIGG